MYDLTVALSFKRAIPFILPPTGSMGANGALTLGTALPTTYANAFIFLPAGAIFAGSAAGWYFVQMSSSTLGTVFNNTYSAGPPNIPAVLNPFVGAGPGAFTGVTTLQTSLNFSIPGNTALANSSFRFRSAWSINNNGNNKTNNMIFGGVTIFALTSTANASIGMEKVVHNRGVSNSQVSDSGVVNTGFGAGAALIYAALDTTQAQALQIQSQLAVATDFIVLESFSIEVWNA